MVNNWSPIEGDGHPTIDTDLDTHFFKIPIVGWMTINQIPCFDRGTYGGFHSHGGTPIAGWQKFQGKSQSKIDDDRGYITMENE